MAVNRLFSAGASLGALARTHVPRVSPRDVSRGAWSRHLHTARTLGTDALKLTHSCSTVGFVAQLPCLLSNPSSRTTVDSLGPCLSHACTGGGALQKLNAINAASPTEPPRMLRVEVESGGCSGFSYKFELTRDVEDDDL